MQLPPFGSSHPFVFVFVWVAFYSRLYTHRPTCKHECRSVMDSSVRPCDPEKHLSPYNEPLDRLGQGILAGDLDPRTSRHLSPHLASEPAPTSSLILGLFLPQNLPGTYTPGAHIHAPKCAIAPETGGCTTHTRTHMVYMLLGTASKIQSILQPQNTFLAGNMATYDGGPWSPL